MSARPPRWGWSHPRRLGLILAASCAVYILVGAVLVWALGRGCPP